MRQNFLGVGVLIIQALTRGPSYGLEIAALVRKMTRGSVILGPGALYPMLHELEHARLLSSRVVRRDYGRPRIYYRLTAKGIRRAHTQRAIAMRVFNVDEDIGL